VSFSVVAANIVLVFNRLLDEELSCTSKLAIHREVWMDSEEEWNGAIETISADGADLTETRAYLAYHLNSLFGEQVFDASVSSDSTLSLVFEEHSIFVPSIASEMWSDSWSLEFEFSGSRKIRGATDGSFYYE